LAINAWEDALKIRPRDPATLNNLGNVYYDFQNFAAALTHYKMALKIEPSFYTAWNNLGNTQMELKDPRSAVESFKKSLKLFDEDPAVHGNLANAYFELRQVERAKFHLRKSLDLGESAVSHHNLAVMEKFTREDKNAGVHYGKALQIRPDYSSARRNAGFWRRRNRDVEKILEGEGEYQGWALRSFKGQGSKQNRRFAIDEARDPFWAPKLR
ncbi:MAG: tetratricopeptide repeat protein, partial [Candidatus Cloacimonetes bacterium]|nr:tetratricopeptide repeat protein [Candidatus Cloacimonadota bacterium]